MLKMHTYLEHHSTKARNLLQTKPIRPNLKIPLQTTSLTYQTLKTLVTLMNPINSLSTFIIKNSPSQPKPLPQENLTFIRSKSKFRKLNQNTHFFIYKTKIAHFNSSWTKTIQETKENPWKFKF